jgi:hypothetical protein
MPEEQSCPTDPVKQEDVSMYRTAEKSKIATGRIFTAIHGGVSSKRFA